MLKNIRHEIISLLLYLVFLAIGYGQIDHQDQPVYTEKFFPELENILNGLPRNSLRLLAAEAEIEEAEGARIVSKSFMYPHLYSDYSLIYGLQQRKDKDSTAQFLPQGNITLTQPIYHWGALEAEKQIGEIRKLTIQGRYEQALTSLKQTLRDLYMSLFLQKKQYAILLENKKNNENELIETQNKFKLGQATSIQLEEQTTNFNETEINLEHAENQIMHATETFRRLSQYCGPLFENDLETQDILDKLPNFAESHHCSKRIQSYEGFFLEKELSIEELNYKKIKAQQLPFFNLKGGLNHEMIRGISTTNRVSQYEVFAGASVNWDIFSGRSTEGQKLTSQARQRRLKIQIQEEENQLELKVMNLAKTLENLYKRINISKKRLNIADKNLKLEKKRMDEGNASLFQYNAKKVQRNHVEYQLLSITIDYIKNLNAYHELTLNY